MKGAYQCLALLSLVSSFAVTPAVASPYTSTTSRVEVDGPTIRGCVLAAAAAHHLPPLMLVILLHVEGGTPGHVTMNSNDTVDIGPMQVNQTWLPKLAAHWAASPANTFLALRDNFCANLDGGAWILRSALDEAHGDFWSGVGIYHSHTPAYKADYLKKVLAAAFRLQAQAERAALGVALNSPRSPAKPTMLADEAALGHGERP